MVRIRTDMSLHKSNSPSNVTPSLNEPGVSLLDVELEAAVSELVAGEAGTEPMAMQSHSVYYCNGACSDDIHDGSGVEVKGTLPLAVVIREIPCPCLLALSLGLLAVAVLLFIISKKEGGADYAYPHSAGKYSFK